MESKTRSVLLFSILLSGGLIPACSSIVRTPAQQVEDSPQETKIREIETQVQSATAPKVFNTFQNLDMKFSFDEMWKIVKIGREKEGYDKASFPSYRVNLEPLIDGTLFKAAHRTLTSRSDISNTDYLRVLHPNGICLSGTWSMDKTAGDKYSGYFQPGIEAKIIARASPHGSNVMVHTNNHNSFGLVGKIFQNEVRSTTADFITQTDLGGVSAASFFETDVSNTPTVSVLNRKMAATDIEVTKFLTTGIIFRGNDSNTTNRQVYRIAELGIGQGPTRSPQFLKLALSKVGKQFPTEPMDFRHEILKNIPFTVPVEVFEGEPIKTLVPPGLKAPLESGQWRRIGEIRFEEAVVSYACDFRIHFHHAPWRSDINDPKTTKENLRDPQ